MGDWHFGVICADAGSAAFLAGGDAVGCWRGEARGACTFRLEAWHVFPPTLCKQTQREAQGVPHAREEEAYLSRSRERRADSHQAQQTIVASRAAAA